MNPTIARLLAAIASQPFEETNLPFTPRATFRHPTPSHGGMFPRGITKPVHNEKKARALRLMQKASRKINRK
jgi:hypothetical protein